MIYSKRPKLTLAPTPRDRWLNRLTFIAMLLLWGYTAWGYASLPATIPLHYNWEGEVDGWGPKLTVWLLPLIGAVVAAGMTALLRHPHLYNYPQTITPENAEMHYRAGMQVLRWTRLIIAYLFLYINYTIIQDAHSQHSSLQLWVMIVAVLLLLLPVLASLFRKKGR